MDGAALLYARVSTDHQEQTNQLLDLRQVAKRKKYKIVGEIIETQSGRKTARAGIEEILTRNDYDVLLVWSLDRLTREGIFPTIQLLQNLKGKGVRVEFVKDSILNTLDNELVFYIMLTVLSALAKSEREKISERTKAGLRRARAQGKILGRRPRAISGNRLTKMLQLRRRGLSYARIGEQVKLPSSTVADILLKNVSRKRVSIK
jgi:putative DNA-invertase from lambdoid prophage Rac